MQAIKSKNQNFFFDSHNIFSRYRFACFNKLFCAFLLRKRFYILFVARGDDGQLRKIPIPVHYLYVFLVGASIVGLSLTGIASSYLRMLLKVSRYNELRTEKEDLRNRYTRLEQVAKERDIQVASLGSLAGEVSSLYGLKSDPNLVTASTENVA